MLMCTSLHTTVEWLKPSLPNYASLQAVEEESREKQEDNFDKRHQAQSLEPLLPEGNMWVTDHHCDGTVVEQTALRS